MRPSAALLFAVFFIAAIAAGTVFATNIRTLDWTVKNQQQLNASPDLQQQVHDLLMRVLPNADISPVNLDQAVFIDIAGNGRLELVALCDESGRGFFNNVFIVSKKNGKYVWGLVRGYAWPETLSQRLVDVDKDGTLELVLQDYIDRYEGAKHVPMKTLVFSWRKGRYVENGEAFPAYYREQVVPELEQAWKKLADRPKASTSIQPPDRYEESVAKTELDWAKARAGMK